MRSAIGAIGPLGAHDDTLPHALGAEAGAAPDAALEVAGGAVILIERALSPRSIRWPKRADQRQWLLRQCADILHDRAERRERALTHEERRRIERRLDTRRAWAVEALACHPVAPCARREAHIALPLSGLQGGRHQQRITHHELIFDACHGRIIRERIEHRAGNRRPRATGLLEKRVEVGQELIAQGNRVAAEGLPRLAERPRLLRRRYHRAVVAIEREEGAKLHEAREQFAAGRIEE